MIRMYFDTCCYCRRFDSRGNSKVVQEIDAIRSIQRFIRRHQVELVWSYVLERECSKIKDDNKRNNVLAWKTFTINNVTETQDITRRALEIQKTGVKEKDALHVACAIAAGCHFFVTTDHRLLKYRSKDIYICDPTECMEFL